MRFFESSVAALELALPFAAAQTSTKCNPLKQTCPHNKGLNKAHFEANFLEGQSAFKSFHAAAGTYPTYGSGGLEFTIAKDGNAPTVQTDFYIFFGRVEVKMKASPGAGIISSMVFLSDDLDEIDWEWIGSNTGQVETNFFGKGNTTTYDRANYYPVSSPQETFHTYTVDWNSDRTEWIIDGKTVRTLKYDGKGTVGGKNYPQSPMRLKLGSWCGGCAGQPEGTVQWSGGPTNFDSAPYVMYVESIKVTNYNPADAYAWNGHSGSWQSIHLIKNGASTKPKGSGKNAAKLARPLMARAVDAGNATLAATGTGTATKPTGTGSTNQGGNSTVKGAGGGIKTSVALSTTHLGGGGPVAATATVAPSGSSASGTPGLSTNGAVKAYGLKASTSLLAVFFAFMLL